MSESGPKNVPASIRAKLLNVSRSTGEDFHVTLARYAVERFLYRLSQSRHRSTRVQPAFRGYLSAFSGQITIEDCFVLRKKHSQIPCGKVEIAAVA